MSYIIEDNKSSTTDTLTENVELKKQIEILKTANAQLTTEKEVYKKAYERYANSFFIKAIRKILRKNDD